MKNEWTKLHNERPHTQTEKIYMASLELALGKISYSQFETHLKQISKG